MARSQTSTQTIQSNIKNSKAVTAVTKVVELVIVNGALVLDTSDTNAGVNSKDF